MSELRDLLDDIDEAGSQAPARGRAEVLVETPAGDILRTQGVSYDDELNAVVITTSAV